MTQKEKTKFRATQKWKKFRNFMKKQQIVDFITKRPLLKGWNLHHLNEKDYKDLNPNNFACLNKKTHDFVHWLARYDDYERIANDLVKMVEKMREFNKLF